MNRQIRKMLFSLTLVVCFILSGCAADYKTVKLENGETCKYYVYQDETADFDGIDPTEASMEEIKILKSDDVEIPSAVGKINSEQDAAKFAAEILNSIYENWTFGDNQLMVGYNENADIYFAHGQAEDREHPQLLGRIIFDAKTGEILHISKRPVEATSLYWDAEKSHFVDYEINGERIKFRYSINFVNCSGEDEELSISAAFKPNELKGWIKMDSNIGYDQNGEMLSAAIKANSSADVVFTFEGEYLGGEVNTNLSFPETLVIMN